MSWITPKTNWKSTDYFNLADYNRITNNINETKSLGDELYMIPDLETMASKTAYTDIMYATDMNRIENNVETINKNSVRYRIGDKVTYSVNSATPTWEEYNRIESALFDLHQEFKAQVDALPHLAFRIGNQRGVRV